MVNNGATGQQLMIESKAAYIRTPLISPSAHFPDCVKADEITQYILL